MFKKLVYVLLVAFVLFVLWYVVRFLWTDTAKDLPPANQSGACPCIIPKIVERRGYRGAGAPSKVSIIVINNTSTPSNTNQTPYYYNPYPPTVYYSNSVPPAVYYNNPVPPVTYYPNPVPPTVTYSNPTPPVVVYSNPTPPVVYYNNPAPSPVYYSAPSTYYTPPSVQTTP